MRGKEEKIRGHLLVGLVLVGIGLVFQGCAIIPPRTIEAAQTEFNDSSLIVGKASPVDVERELGSPSEIRKGERGSKSYVYLRNRETTGISVDVGTTYVAEYTFTSDGKLKEKNYRATPMSNPLIH